MSQRRVTCAILAVLAAHTTASAGDFPGLKPSAPVATYDWTGFYVGGHLGGGFSYRNWTLAPGATAEAGDAVLLGGQAGFNYRLGKLVTGVEADASWGNLKDENFCPDGINTCWTRQNWLATVTGRIGLTYDMALFYVKGGAAFTRTDHFVTAQIPSPFDERGTSRRTAPTGGFGMEYALWNGWTMRLEYDYLDFGSRSVAMSNIATGQFAESILLRQKAHEVKLGLNYLFNPGNWMPVYVQQKQSSEPQPQRTGLPAPLDSPPFPSGDWPLGGSQVIGAPDTAVGPLMKWLYDGPNGQAWKDSHIKIYGWGEIGANGSNSRDTLAPAGYPIRPNRLELDQLVFRIERLPDTVQKDHVEGLGELHTLGESDRALVKAEADEATERWMEHADVATPPQTNLQKLLAEHFELVGQILDMLDKEESEERDD